MTVQVIDPNSNKMMAYLLQERGSISHHFLCLCCSPEHSGIVLSYLSVCPDTSGHADRPSDNPSETGCILF